MKKGGTCACIVPDGVLFGSSKAHVALRKEIIEKKKRKMVASHTLICKENSQIKNNHVLLAE